MRNNILWPINILFLSYGFMVIDIKPL